MKKFTYILLLGIIIIGSRYSGIEAKQIWVSPTGSPSGDGSITNPYDITTACQQKIQPGDIVMAKEGVYELKEEIVITISGTKNNPITIKSADDKHKSIIKILESHDMGFAVIKANYITIDGFEFREGDRGINIVGWDENGNHQPCKGITIRNCKFVGNIPEKNNMSDAIKVTWADDILVEYNEFLGCEDEQLDLIGVFGGMVRYNTFKDLYVWANGAAQFKGGSKDIIIEKNFFNVKNNSSGFDVRLGGYTGNQWIRTIPNIPSGKEGFNQVFRNNVIYEPNNLPSVHAAKCLDGKIYNNTIWGGRGGYKVFVFWEECSDIKVCNNIVMARGNIEKLYDTDATSGTNFVGKNNLFWDGDGRIEWGSIGKDRHTNTFQVDPLLMDPVNANFHLRENSPAIDAGIDLQVTEDYEGTSRPQRNGFDLGAFEFKPLVPTIGDNIQCYPNPSRGGEYITFKGISNARIRIFNISGELVKEKETRENSEWEWDLTNNDKKQVSSGTYIYVITKSNKIIRGKIGVIR